MGDRPRHKNLGFMYDHAKSCQHSVTLGGEQSGNASKLKNRNVRNGLTVLRFHRQHETGNA